MTKISSSTGMVALVQTSLMLPVALVSTPAGAIADMFDRRIVGLVALGSPRTGYGNVGLFLTQGSHLGLRGLPGGGRSPAKPVCGGRR
jgi:MFS family permease